MMILKSKETVGLHGLHSVKGSLKNPKIREKNWIGQTPPTHPPNHFLNMHNLGSFGFCLTWQQDNKC